MNPILLVLAGVVAFTVFGGLAYGAYLFFNPTRTASDRLRDMAEDEKPEMFELAPSAGGGGGSLSSRIGRLAEPTKQEDVQKLRQMLLQAGYRTRHAPEMFNMARVTLALCLPMLTFPVMLINSSTTSLAIGVFVAAAIGYYAPWMMLSNTVEKRKKDLLRSFPDALDLLVSSVEAGLGLDAAFRRVAAEMETSSPDLARELQLVNHEIGAGRTRLDALKNLELRTGLDEIRSLVNMLTQAERFGTSIAKSLRVHARMTRQKRMSRAEEEAAKVSPKLTVVMILFLLPVLMAILVGPAAIGVMDTLASNR